jgi:DNA-binding transcriptional regulator/RsmH inhibitor MraZ
MRDVLEKWMLWLYPMPEWEKLEQTISKLPTLNKMAGKLRRFVMAMHPSVKWMDKVVCCCRKN